MKNLTLLEWVIIFTIIGILAAIAIPKFANTRARSAPVQQFDDSGLQKVYDHKEGVVCYIHIRGISCLRTR